MKQKLNDILDYCILEAYTTVQNNQQDNFGIEIFLYNFFSQTQMVNGTITFHDHSTVRADFLDNRFAHMKWFLIEFENN